MDEFVFDIDHADLEYGYDVVNHLTDHEPLPDDLEDEGR